MLTNLTGRPGKNLLDQIQAQAGQARVRQRGMTIKCGSGEQGKIDAFGCFFVNTAIHGANV
jgi:hypothetical protein